MQSKWSPKHFMFDGVSSGSQTTQFLWQNFEFRVRAINGLQICSLKPSELCAISFTFCVFLCRDVSFKLKYLSSVHVAKNASAACSWNIDFAERLLWFSMATFTLMGLLEVLLTSETSPSINMQNRLYCQNIYLNITTSLTGFLID